MIGLIWLLVDHASACVGRGSFETIFFDEIPRQLSAPVVARITITRLDVDPSSRIDIDRAGPLGRYVAVARVDEVLKGDIAQGSVKIIADGTVCDQKLHVGSEGIVAGQLVVDAWGELQFVLVSHRLLDTRRLSR
jgi:hypothetical protein